ncbi:MAG: leucine-rich repeat domain-containing protein [Ruminococcaceae bacterium]|nr:leucine-rich repeat domain-containing protein [Oscillospiraceae bacterium]
MNIRFKKVLALLLVLTMMFSMTSVATVLAADGDTEQTTTEVTDPPVTGEDEEDDEEEINIKGDPLTTKDGLFEYYKYELTDETAGTTEYILEIKAYLGEDKIVEIPAKLDEPEASPYSVKIIGTDAFAENTVITRVTLPDTVEKISTRAFNNCTSLYNINLTDSIKEIGNYAFGGCGEISAIHMPAAVERIGTGAFFGCKKLVGNTTIPSEIQNEDGTYDMVRALTFPETLTYIGDSAFVQCESLVNVIIPSSITAIYTGTFANCEGLEKVDIPYEVTYVGAAFNGAFTAHARTSTYEPTLIIRNPHCVIVLSDEMDKHMVIKGVKYSLVNHMAEEGNYAFEPIAAPAQHNYSYTGVVTPPTCYEDGYTTYTCSCGEYDDFCITDYVPSPGHQYGEWYLGHTGEGDESTMVAPEDVFVNGTESGGIEDILGNLTGGEGSSGNFDDLFDDISGAVGGEGGESTGESTTEGSGNLEDVLGGLIGGSEDSNGEKVTLVSDKPISEAEFEEICKAGLYKNNCTSGEGISRKCTECGKIQYGKTIPTGHMVYKVTTATCTEFGVVKEKCAGCGIALTHQAAGPLGHVWHEETERISEYEKCKTDGVLRYTCTVCNGTMDEIVPAHADADKNNVCDDCGTELQPTECSCGCHKTGFIWDLLNAIRLIVWKLFKVEKHCACGVLHY